MCYYSVFERLRALKPKFDYGEGIPWTEELFQYIELGYLCAKDEAPNGKNLILLTEDLSLTSTFISLGCVLGKAKFEKNKLSNLQKGMIAECNFRGKRYRGEIVIKGFPKKEYFLKANYGNKDHELDIKLMGKVMDSLTILGDEEDKHLYQRKDAKKAPLILKEFFGQTNALDYVVNTDDNVCFLGSKKKLLSESELKISLKHKETEYTGSLKDLLRPKISNEMYYRMKYTNSNAISDSEPTGYTDKVLIFESPSAYLKSFELIESHGLKVLVVPKSYHGLNDLINSINNDLLYADPIDLDITLKNSYLIGYHEST